MTRRRKSNTSSKNGQAKSAPSGNTQSGDAQSSGSAAQASGAGNQQRSGQRKWYRVDLHLHTPGSNDYEERTVTYYDWMQKVLEKELDIVAITDHNTVAGIGAIQREIEWLTRLEKDGRLTEEETARLKAWREFSNKVLVLPGFEFTA
ncbi:MAG: PHP domain-containing protein, partial [Caldilineaceae bacterium]|nr:PHP domain-containing protein [Caldilineaceae bacterium]